MTNYRYYSADQLPRLNRMLALKGLGLSLEQIGLLLDEDLPVSQIRGMLRLKQLEIQEHLNQGQIRLDQVEHMLRKIENEEKMPKHEITLKPINSLEVITVRDTVPSYKDIGQIFDQVFSTLGKHQIQPAGPPIGIYHDPDYQESDVDIEVAVPISSKDAAEADFPVKTLPSEKQMACIFHQGGYSTIGASYGHLMQWVEENNFQITGPVREVYLRGPESGAEENYMTEIQLPVQK